MCNGFSGDCSRKFQNQVRNDMAVNTERKSTLKGSWLLLLCVATGGFGYSLGFQQGQADGQNNTSARLDFVTAHLRDAQERLQQQEEEPELPARHPAAVGSDARTR